MNSATLTILGLAIAIQGCAPEQGTPEQGTNEQGTEVQAQSTVASAPPASIVQVEPSPTQEVFDGNFFLIQNCTGEQGALLKEISPPVTPMGKHRYSVGMAVCNGRATLRLEELDYSPNPTMRPGTERSKYGTTYHLIDFMSMGTLKPGHNLTLAPYCHNTGRMDRGLEWFAIYDTTKKYPYTWENGGIVAAWVVNPETLRFEMASEALLRSAICISETDDED